MAVVTLKASQVTNADATTQTLNNSKVTNGRIKEIADTIELTSGDSIASIYRMARVHSSWRMTEVLLQCDAITTCAGDIGLYDTAGNGAAVVDVDCFASAQSLATAIIPGTNVMGEAASVFGDVANVRKSIWEVLGLAADPNKFYDVAVTLTAAAGSAGTVSVKARYCDGN